MAYYRFSLDVTSGANPDGTMIIGDGYLSNGQKISMRAAASGGGPGLPDGSGGYSTLEMTTEPVPEAGYAGVNVVPTESVWFSIIEFADLGDGPEVAGVFTIGPYTIGDIGVEVV